MSSDSYELNIPQNIVSLDEEDYVSFEVEDKREYPYIKIHGIESREELVFIQDLCSRNLVDDNKLELVITQEKNGILKEKYLCDITMSLDLLDQIYYISGGYILSIQTKDKELPIRFDDIEMVTDFLVM